MQLLLLWVLRFRGSWDSNLEGAVCVVGMHFWGVW
jgi:hypothetical protein